MKLCSRMMLIGCTCIATLALSASVSYGQNEACCLANGTCQDLLVISCTDLGGTPQGAGSTCTGNECQACCLPPLDTCVNLLVTSCTANGGTPQGAGTTCTPVEGCCFPDGTCSDLDPLCCADKGGVPCGPGNLCQGDNNGNGVDDACENPMSDHIPAVSNLGLLALLLLTAVAGVIVIRRSRRGHVAG